MAYRKPNDLDGFIQQMPKADMRVKTQLAEDLVTFLSDDTNAIVCSDLGLLVDNLMPWLTGSHFKIAQKSLEAFSELIKRLGPDFNAYTATVLPHVIDRLGDSKDTVREKAQLLLQNLMEHRVLTQQALLDKLANTCLKHKNAKVREEFLQTIVNTLNEYGNSHVSVRTYIQLIATHLLGDPNAVVRDSAIQTLVEIYKHVGERMRFDLRRIEDIPPAKLSILEQKFTQVKNEGLLLKSAANISTSNNGSNGHNASSSNALHSTNGIEETDDASMNSLQPRSSRLVKRTVSATTRVPIKGDLADAGALTMDAFETCFEQVPHLNIFSGKDLDDVYKQIFTIISDKNADWEKRVEALKKLRSLLVAQAHTQPQFTAQLKDLAICFLDILKEELRSQVIREACITIAYMSKSLRQKFDQFCISILDQLILLIQNSAKVIASSSFIAMKYIVKYTHAPKIIKILTDNYQQSKSKDIRASLCEILCLLLEEWPTKYLERHANLLRDTLKKSISDADNEARRHSRRAYWLYRQHFPDYADYIYGTLDIATQRALERERDGGSCNPTSLTNTRFLRMPGGNSIQKPTAGTRSVSAVDSAAAQRAKARYQYSLSARKKVQNTNNITTNTPGSHSSNVTGSLPRPRYGMGTVTANAAIAENTGRTRSRSGVSQSQPGSRSTSPSSKLREQYGAYYKPITGTIPKKTAGSSGIPRSLANSRETSPTRGPMKRSLCTLGSSSHQRRTPEGSTRPLAAARLLQQSREAEGLLGADVLSHEEYSQIEYNRNPRYGRKFLSREESDDSEASSVCSERSFESNYTRGHNSSYSLSGSRQRLDWSSSRAVCEDIDTIILYCASTHWAERKDGLNSLTHYLSAGKELAPNQLQGVLDMFRKMFMDTHTKVYSLFLDAVTELILVHANDLHDWLFILLTRLFNKLGTELLNSMTGKILKTLQVVHEYFPTDLQMRDILRILSDNAQTPCIKSKIAMLKFLTELATTYCQPCDLPAADGGGGGTGSNSLSVDRALLKIVQLCGNHKSLELSGQARLCLVALYNCNTPQMTKWLAVLPKTAQDDAKSIIQTFLEFHSNSPSSSPLSSSSPKPLQSPLLAPFISLQNTPLHTHTLNASPRSRQASVEQDLYSQLDVQHNIHKTSEEIRNYTSSVVAQDTSNMASQINLLNNANGFNGYGHDDELDSNTNSYCNSKTQPSASTETNTPESSSNNTIQQQQESPALVSKEEENPGQNVIKTTNRENKLTDKFLIKYSKTDSGELILDETYLESEVIKIACSLSVDVPMKQLQGTLNNLSVCIKGGNGELPNKHFRSIMKMLVELIDTQQPEIVIEALLVLSKIIRSENMRSNWIVFLELILLRIIGCYQLSKETAREIDLIIPRIAPALPLHAAIDIVNPVIATSPYPLNLCAVKMLSELAERHGSELTDAHLNNVFPNLASLADNQQSMVRKAAVFCIVKLYFVMGEEKVKPKFSMLTPSKVRLLNVYIEKQRTSSSTSTKNSSAASSS